MKIPRKYLWIGSGLLAFTLFALIQLPASIMLSKLPAQLRMDGVEGTLWRGRATALGLGGTVLQQNVHWTFNPGALFSGRLGWNFTGQYRNDQSRVQILLTPKHFEVRDADIALPLEPLLAQDEKLKTLRFGGILRISAQPFSNKAPYTLNARIENLFSSLTTGAGPLGSYQLTLNMLPDGNGDWQVTHQEGTLTVNGAGKLETKGPSGSLRLKPDENAAPYLQTMLAMLPRADDGYMLNLPM